MQWYTMIFCYTQNATYSNHPQKDFLLQNMKSNWETHRQTLGRESKLEISIRVLFRDQEMGRKDGRNQRGRRPPWEQSPLYQLSRNPVGSQRWKCKARDLAWVYTGPLHTCCGCKLDVFMGPFPSICLWLFHLFLGLFSSCWVHMSSLGVSVSCLVFILLCFSMFDCCLLGNCSFLKGSRGEVNLEMRQGQRWLGDMEGWNTVVGMYCMREGTIFNWK